MLMVGTMIGAGYASGQEIAAFFGFAPSIFVPVFCGVLFFVFSVVLLMVGKSMKTDSLTEVHTALFGKMNGVVDITMLFNGVIILAAMIAAMDNTITILTGFAFPYGILFALLCVYILRFNTGLLNANVIVVPFIIIFLAMTCFSSPLSLSLVYARGSLTSCFIYVFMNLLLSAGVLVRVNGLSTKQIIISSLISSTVIALLMALIAAVLPNAEGQSMPLVSIAGDGLIYYLFIISLIIAIFTTLLSALSPLRSWAGIMLGDNDLGALAALIVAGLTACIGFETVVGFFYPIIGIIGIVYIIFAVVYLIRKSSFFDKYFFNKSDRTVHKRGKHAKNDCACHHQIDFKDLPAVNNKIAESR